MLHPLLSGFARLIERRLERNFGRSAEVAARSALLTGDTVDRSAGDQVAVESDGARGVVVARDRIVDQVRIAVRVDDGDDRDAEALGFVDRDPDPCWCR